MPETDCEPVAESTSAAQPGPSAPEDRVCLLYTSPSPRD